jgi:hydrogenase nickel incorporation protein HypA/HybF
MHEAGLCEAVLAVVRDVSEDAPVRRVRLRVGRLQGVVPDVFEFCWRMVAEDTGAAQASLELLDVPVVVHCRACGADGGPVSDTFACAACGSPAVDVISGRQLEVEEVELSDGEIRRNPQLAAAGEAH